MSEKKGSVSKRPLGEPYTIVKERLSGTSTDLTSFFFHPGANIYVFSYEKEGVRRHTFIDTGDSRYRNRILSILTENDIDPTTIERIIMTHRHPDHCSLAALLARESGARILVHPNFRSLVEGEVEENEQRWWNGFDPSQLKECDIEYLPQSDKSAGRSINGVNFPILGEPIEIGEGAKLEILACPECTPTHSPDQIVILYSPRNGAGEGFRPTDNILFSGDLWLITGPLYSRSIGSIFRRVRYGFVQLKNLVSGKGIVRRNARDQDPRAKEALKKGFSLIRVGPGHGKEFMGSRIIPYSMLAERDMLLALGYPLNANKSILKQRDLTPRVAALREQGYTSFVEELLYWRKLGYTSNEISELLVRIYKEQTGGDKLTKKDRGQRREELKGVLTRLKDDKAQPEELHQLALSTLFEFQREDNNT